LDDSQHNAETDLDKSLPQLLSSPSPVSPVSTRANDQHEQEEYLLWLSYWVVYGFIEIAEVPFDFIFKRFSGYFFLKAIFILWVFLEFKGSRGCTYVYKYVVGPLLRHFQPHLDHGIDKGLVHAQQAGSEVFNVGISALGNGLTNVISPSTVVETASSFYLKAKAAERQNQTDLQSGKKKEY